MYSVSIFQVKMLHLNLCVVLCYIYIIIIIYPDEATLQRKLPGYVSH